MSTIVVGLDVSRASAAALRWATDYARLTGGTLVAVHAMPVTAALAKVWPDEVWECTVEELFAAVDPNPDWRLEFYLDDPGPAVVRAAENAAAIVVGTREHSGLGRLVYGSVSRYCLSHAKVPVVAVPFVAARVATTD